MSKEILQNKLNKIIKENPSFPYFNDNQKSANIHWLYGSLFDAGVPSVEKIELDVGCHISTTKKLSEFNFFKIYEEKCHNVDANYMTKEIWANIDGYLIELEIDNVRLNEALNNLDVYKKLIKNENKNENKKDSVELINYMEILFPSEMFRNDNEHKQLLDNIYKIFFVNEKKKKNKKQKAQINILVKDGFDVYFKEFDITKFTGDLTNPNLIYGNEFSEFNDKLIDRLKTDKKGLVLLHGPPGTGKTYYIRYLLKILSKHKRIIFIPSSFINELSSPETINFLIDDIIEEKRDTVLLMEDAEELLESRKTNDTRVSGISNLLNATDGILNDLLGLIVIGTFNVELSQIDDALLRTGRLLGRKKFELHDYDTAVKIAKEFKLEEKFKENETDKDKKFSMSDILNYKDKKETLIHDIIKQHKNENSSIGFKNKNKNKNN